MKGWKTLAAAALIAAGGVAEQADWVDLVGPQYEGWVLLGIGALMAALRVATTTPVGGTKE